MSRHVQHRRCWLLSNRGWGEAGQAGAMTVILVLLSSRVRKGSRQPSRTIADWGGGVTPCKNLHIGFV
jgi:hypothetical protein